MMALVFCQMYRLKDQVDEIRKREQSSSPSYNHNFSGLGHLKFKSKALGRTELERILVEVCIEQG
jgi:hypothetical protein